MGKSRNRKWYDDEVDTHIVDKFEQRRREKKIKKTEHETFDEDDEDMTNTPPPIQQERGHIARY